MKSRSWYIVAAVLLAVGLAGAGWTMWSGLSGIADTMVRFVIPGSGEVTLSEPGNYTIFHETESVIGDRVYNVPSISNLTVGVTDTATGQNLPVTAPGMHSTYTMGGHSGVSVLAFNAPHPGRYRLTASYGSGAGAPQTVLAVDRGFFGRLFRTVVVTLGFAMLAGIAAPAIGFTTYFRRRKMLRGADHERRRLGPTIPAPGGASARRGAALSSLKPLRENRRCPPIMPAAGRTTVKPISSSRTTASRAARCFPS